MGARIFLLEVLPFEAAFILDDALGIAAAGKGAYRDCTTKL